MRGAPLGHAGLAGTVVAFSLACGATTSTRAPGEHLCVAHPTGSDGSGRDAAAPPLECTEGEWLAGLAEPGHAPCTWRGCVCDADCVLAPGPCGAVAPVNRAHEADERAALERLVRDCAPAATLEASAICVHGACTVSPTASVVCTVDANCVVVGGVCGGAVPSNRTHEAEVRALQERLASVVTCDGEAMGRVEPHVARCAAGACIAFVPP